MNLDMAEFDKLAEYAGQIRDAVREMQEAHQPAYHPREITLHKFIYLCPLTSKIVRESQTWFMNATEAKAEGASYDSCLDFGDQTYQKRPEMCIIDSTFEIPDNGTLVKKAFIYAIKLIVESIRERECSACKMNYPYSNPDHDLGCCQPWDATVETFYQEHILEPLDLQEMVLRIVRVINDSLPQKEQQGLLKEKLHKSNWPSAIDVINYEDSIGQELLAVLVAAEKISRPAYMY